MTKTPEGGVQRREVISGLAASATLAFVNNVAPFPGLSGSALAQTSHGHGNKEMLEAETTAQTVNFPELEKQQIERYKAQPDENVVMKDGVIHEFYGITRQEVIALPGLHPTPDVYRQFRFRNKNTGQLNSCCDGSDCRPAIIKMLGNGRIAVGVHYRVGTQSVALFYNIHIDETNIVSTETITNENKEYAKHKFHACVYGGRLYCAGFPVEG